MVKDQELFWLSFPSDFNNLNNEEASEILLNSIQNACNLVKNNNMNE